MPACTDILITLKGRRSKYDDRTDALASMHQVKGCVDVLKPHDVRDHRVDLDLPGHVHIDNLGNVRPPLGTAKGRAAPVAAGDELERAGRNFLASSRHTDDDRRAPAAMAS